MTVIQFPYNENLYVQHDIDVDGVLNSNMGRFKRVFLIGIDYNEQLTLCSSTSNLDSIVSMLERAKTELMKHYEA